MTAEQQCVTVRYWAAAKAASGTASDEVAPGTVATVLAACRDAHGERLARVLEVCSFLVDEHPVGTRAHEDVEVPAGAVLDVLPPFAGG